MNYGKQSHDSAVVTLECAPHFSVVFPSSLLVLSYYMESTYVKVF